MVGSPDVDTALPCPLCGYDLRGLPAGRCPECGHAFEPKELRREASLRHPYLFEHWPRRFYWSIPRTLIGMAMPGRFWRRLRPEMPVRMPPLVFFAIASTLLIVVLLGASWAPDVVKLAMGNRAQLKKAEQTYASLQPAEQRRLDFQHGGAGAFLAVQRSWYPGLETKQFWREASYYVDFRDALFVAPTLAAWPWLTLLTLLLFRQSLRQAKIGRGHLLRCCAYSSLPLLLIVPLAAGVALLPGEFKPFRLLGRFDPSDYGTLYQFLRLRSEMIVAVPIALLLSGYSLWRAYTRYLRFRHATATVVASQAIAWLAIMVRLTLAPRGYYF